MGFGFTNLGVRIKKRWESFFWQGLQQGVILVRGYDSDSPKVAGTQSGKYMTSAVQWCFRV